MSTSTNETRLCFKCGLTGAFQCSGCQQLFCLNCFRCHREDISTQLTNILDENARLRYVYGHREIWSDHPVLNEINNWECRTIDLIKQIASETRDELRRLISERNIRMDKLLIQSSLNLQHLHQEHEFIEKALIQMREQLNKIKTELETPFQIQLKEDHDRTPIYYIQLQVSNEINDLPNIESLAVQIDSREKVSNTLALVQLSTSEIDSQLCATLKKLHTGELTLMDDSSDWLTQLVRNEPDTLVIDMHKKSIEEQDNLLNQLSTNLKHTRSIYIQGNLPENDNDCVTLFTKYPFIKAIFDNEQRLIIQWAMDTVNEHRKFGDKFIQNGNKDKARASFVEGIELYKRLSNFLNENKCII